MFKNPGRGKQARNFTNKCSENSRSQIVFWTDIFQKFTLGAPECWGEVDYGYLNQSVNSTEVQQQTLITSHTV